VLAAFTFFYAQFFQDHFQRAKLGKAALKQIGADKHGEPKPVTIMKKGATLHT
jgi:hypothetical protein